MAKSKQAAKKKSTKPTSSPSASIEERLARSLARKPQKPAPEDDQPQVSVGDKVTFPQSDTIYTITRVSPSGKQVDLTLPGTNIERFRVNIDDLDFLTRSTPRRPPKPVKPAIDIEAVREHLDTAQHSSMDQLSGDIATLKKYLRSKGVRASAIDELDSLCEATEKRWAAVVEEILGSLSD
jgi:hypothetical protein